MNYKIPQSVLVVIYTKELDVLLLERAGNLGYWQSVTGSKDTLDEPFILTAKREVKEETGICIGEGEGEFSVPPENLKDWNITNQYEIYALWRDRYAPLVTHNTEHVFGLCVPRTIPVFLSVHEHVRYEWLPYQQAAERCFSPSNKEAILALPEYV